MAAPLTPTSSAPGAAHLPQYRDLWFENPSARDPRGLPHPAPHPPPEGYQPQVSHTQPRFYPPRLPQSYSTLAPADPMSLRQDQPSPFVPPNMYPLDRPWDQMSDYQRQVRVAQDQRDRFIHQLFQDTGDLMAERQFDRLPNFNQFTDRDAFMNFLAGDTSLVTHFKDKWGYLYQKYHLNQ
jgi:hypothetical protein